MPTPTNSSDVAIKSYVGSGLQDADQKQSGSTFTRLTRHSIVGHLRYLAWAGHGVFVALFRVYLSAGSALDMSAMAGAGIPLARPLRQYSVLLLVVGRANIPAAVCDPP
jgi:hypothetical protein